MVRYFKKMLLKYYKVIVIIYVYFSFRLFNMLFLKTDTTVSDFEIHTSGILTGEMSHLSLINTGSSPEGDLFDEALFCLLPYVLHLHG